MEVTAPELQTDGKEVFFRVVGFLALFVLGGVVGFFLTKAFINPDLSSEFPAPYKLFAIPLIFVALFLSIAFHEAGHLAGGLSAGFTFSVFIVGPFMLVREGNRIVFKWNRGLGFFGGMAACMPRDTHNLMRRFLISVAGGPLASLLLALAAFVVIRAFDLEAHENTLRGFLLSFGVHALGWVSGGVFLIACLPMKSAGFYTDGARIINLLRGGNLAKLDAILMTTLTESATGTRPRDLNLSLLQEATTLPVQSVFRVYAHLYLYYAALDAENPEAARQHLTAAFAEKKLLPRFYEGILGLEKSFFEAVFEKNAPQARQDFEQVKPNNFIPAHTHLRTKTAVLLAENQADAARHAAAEALKAIKKSTDMGVATWEKQWLESIVTPVV